MTIRRMLPATRIGLAAIGLTALVLAGCGGKNGAGPQTREAAEGLPLRDDFEGECTWPQEDDEADKLACERGYYAVVFKDVEKSIAHWIPRRTKTGYTSVGVEAKTSLHWRPRRDDRALRGIGCWASGRGEPVYGYVFALATLGDGRQGILIARHDESDERLRSSLGLEFLVDEAIELNRSVASDVEIRGECRKEGDRIRLAFYVDGEGVATAEDARGGSSISSFVAYGFVAVATRTGTKVHYDDFVAHQLPR